MLKITQKFEGFDRKSRPRPFKTMFPHSDFFFLFYRIKHYSYLLHVTE